MRSRGQKYRSTIDVRMILTSATLNDIRNYYHIDSQTGSLTPRPGSREGREVYDEIGTQIREMSKPRAKLLCDLIQGVYDPASAIISKVDMVTASGFHPFFQELLVNREKGLCYIGSLNLPVEEQETLFECITNGKFWRRSAESAATTSNPSDIPYDLEEMLPVLTTEAYDLIKEAGVAKVKNFRNVIERLYGLDIGIELFAEILGFSSEHKRRLLDMYKDNVFWSPARKDKQVNGLFYLKKEVQTPAYNILCEVPDECSPSFVTHIQMLLNNCVEAPEFVQSIELSKASKQKLLTLIEQGKFWLKHQNNNEPLNAEGAFSLYSNGLGWTENTMHENLDPIVNAVQKTTSIDMYAPSSSHVNQNRGTEAQPDEISKQAISILQKSIDHSYKSTTTRGLNKLWDQAFIKKHKRYIDAAGMQDFLTRTRGELDACDLFHIMSNQVNQGKINWDVVDRLKKDVPAYALAIEDVLNYGGRKHETAKHTIINLYLAGVPMDWMIEILDMTALKD